MAWSVSSAVLMTDGTAAILLGSPVPAEAAFFWRARVRQAARALQRDLEMRQPGHPESRRAVGGGAPQPALDDLDRCDRLRVAEARREQLTRREVPNAEAADRLRDVAATARHLVAADVDAEDRRG